MNYTKDQLLDILKKTVCKCELGGVALILEALITGAPLPTTPAGSRLQIFKHPANNNPLALEANDMVTGWMNGSRFVTALYRGEDPTNWSSFSVLNDLDNLEIQ